MPKRRAGSPPIVDRSSKRLSLANLAAKASSSSLKYESDGSFLSIFMPGGRLKRNSTINLRTPSRPLLRPQPLQPGLHLSSRPLQTHADHDVATLKELLVFPTSLAMIKQNCIFRFSMNCTPQLGPALPTHVEHMLYNKYVSTRLFPRPERLPYIHIGSTALGFRVNFYLILPYASTASSPAGTGHMCYNDLQAVYDHVIRPALEAAYPRRQPWGTWTEAKNESHLKPLKSRRKSARSEPQEERMHCEGLGTFWDAIEECSDNFEVAHLLRGKQLVAYGDVADHDWQTDWRPTWAQFQQLWNDGVDVDYVGPDTKFTMEMSLGFDDVVGGGHRDFGSSSRSHSRMAMELPDSRMEIPDFPLPPSRSETPISMYHGSSMPPELSVRRATSRATSSRSTTPNALNMNPPSRYSPPASAPPKSPLPDLPPNVVIKKRSKRYSSRHSIKLVEEPDNFFELP